MSISKMTFSLASLILMFGLVFAPTTVMAHPASDTTVGPHTHPVTEVVDPDPDATPPVLGVPIHGAHPVPTITLKPNADQVKRNEVIIAADDAATTDVAENAFTVVISFDMPVTGDPTAEAAADTFTIPTARFQVLLLDKMGNPITTNPATIAEAARVNADATAAATATDPIEAIVTIPDASVPDGTGNMQTLTIRILLAEGTFAPTGQGTAPVAYGLQQDIIEGVNVIPVRGGHSVESALAEFKLVQTFTNRPPTVDITTDEPTTPVDTGSFPVAYTTNDPDGNTVTVTAGDLPAGYAITPTTLPASGTLTITQTPVSPTNRTVDAATVTLTLTATDDGTPSQSRTDTLAIPFAGDTYDPPTATVTVEDDTYHGGGRFLVTFTFDTNDAPTDLMAASIDAGTGARVVPDSVSPVSSPPTGKVQWTAVIESLLPNNDNDIIVTVTGDDIEAAATDGSVSVMAAPPTPVAPGAPAGLAAAAGVESVTLTWTAVSGVMYEYSKDGGTNWEDVPAANAGNLTLSNLTAGTAIIFSVRVKETSTHLASAAVTATATPRPKPAADAPANLQATAGVESAAFTWTAVSGVMYEYSKDGGTNWEDVPAANAGNLTLSNLTAGTAIIFSVRVKETSTHLASAAVTATATPRPKPAADAPANLQATAGIESATFTWDAVQGVTYEYKVDDGAWTDVTAAAGNLTLSSLTAGTAIIFSVRVKETSTHLVGPAAMVAVTPIPRPIEPDTTPPTVGITIANQLDMGKVVFTLSFSEELGTGVNALSLSDIEITGGTAEAADLEKDASDPTMYTLKVTPTDANTSVTISLRANSVADMAGVVLVTGETTTETYDVTPPVVTITSTVDATTGEVLFVLSFDEALGAALSIADLRVTNAAPLKVTDLALVVPTATEPLPEGVAEQYALAVTPTDATLPNVLDLAAGSVADMARNPIDGQRHTYTPPPPDPGDTTAPTISIAAGTQDGRTLPVTITVADETGLGTATGDAMLDAATEITVTGGTLGTLTASTTTAGEYSADITIDYDVTTVTVAVAAGAVKDSSNNPSALASMDFTVTATPMPVTPVDGQFTFPAESYTVIVHSGGHAGLPSSVTPLIWMGMPDLENLLYTGGTIAITMADADFDHDGDGADATTGKKADGTDGTKPRKPGTRDLVITEVMWARNLAEVGKADENAHQWIEVYNNLKVAVTATISSKGGQPALGAGAGQILVDRLSNVVGARWQLAGLGQNGSDDGTGGAAEVDFISMFRKERGKDGHTKGHWAPSTETYLANHKGTPGAKERSQVGTVTATSFNVGGLIFNEISNRIDAEKAYEWIELRNKSGGAINPKNWQISIVTAVGSDVELITLPNNDGVNTAAGGLLLLVASDPSADPNHPLAAGWNVLKNAANQVNGVNSNSPRYVVVDFKNNGLPDDGEFVLILRNHNNKRGTTEHLIDIAGYDTNLKVSANEAGYTNLWPLKGGVRDAQLSNNKLAVGEVHRRQKDNIWGTSSTNYGRNNGNHHDDTAWRNDGWTGVGYKRNATPGNANGGTPGYDNGAIKATGIAQSGQVIISEIMYDTSRNLPQWIELQNLSTSVGVNIDNWSLFIVNHDKDNKGEDYAPLSERIDLDGKIPPGQTFLIVSTGSRHNTNLPNGRIWNLRRGRGAKLLNPKGFRITLKANTQEGDANKHQTVDDVGNMPDKPDDRRANAQSFLDPVWELPSSDRVSIARKTTKKMDDAKRKRAELQDLQKNGVNKGGWILSDADARLSRMQEATFYGHERDVGSPGQSVGSVLPVSLSKFRPERLKDTGQVVIRWITESELNNAGFNILRSEKRDGEFTKVNTKLIAGHGTTSERHAYTHTDTSAKPNVVYYYQIQDVSLDGEVTTLRTTHLRGNVTAVGKATTTWGEIKALQ